MRSVDVGATTCDAVSMMVADTVTSLVMDFVIVSSRVRETLPESVSVMDRVITTPRVLVWVTLVERDAEASLLRDPDTLLVVETVGDRVSRKVMDCDGDAKEIVCVVLSDLYVSVTSELNV